jgi:hypothetical protein
MSSSSSFLYFVIRVNKEKNSNKGENNFPKMTLLHKVRRKKYYSFIASLLYRISAQGERRNILKEKSFRKRKSKFSVKNFRGKTKLSDEQ